MLSLIKVSVTKHAVIRTDLAEDLPAIRANAAQLRQIVMNLVTNASDAIGDRDGVIRLITRRVAAAEESDANLSRTPANHDCVELEVSDTGCGMSSETQAKISTRSSLLSPRAWTRARCRPRDRAESRWNNPVNERTGPRHYISNISAMCGNRR